MARADVLSGKINPDDFAAWLTTQTNANGSLFLINVAKRYAHNLSSAPHKLVIPLTAEERNVFCCLTINEFDRLCEVFRNAPNYHEVNHQADHEAFSAGLGAYRQDKLTPWYPVRTVYRLQLWMTSLTWKWGKTEYGKFFMYISKHCTDTVTLVFFGMLHRIHYQCS